MTEGPVTHHETGGRIESKTTGHEILVVCIAAIVRDATRRLDSACLFRPVDVAVLNEVRSDRRPRLVFPHAKFVSDFYSESLVEARAELDLIDIRHREETNFDGLAGSMKVNECRQLGREARERLLGIRTNIVCSRFGDVNGSPHQKKVYAL